MTSSNQEKDTDCSESQLLAVSCLRLRIQWYLRPYFPRVLDLGEGGPRVTMVPGGPGLLIFVVLMN